MTVNVLPFVCILVLETDTAASPCSCQVTAMADGRKPEDVHVATVETVVVSISVPEVVTRGSEGRTGK